MRSFQFPDEQRRIGRVLLAKSLEPFARECRELYHTNQQLMYFLRGKHLPLPMALRTAAESTLNADISDAAQRLMVGQLTPDELLERIRGYQSEAKRLECSLEFDPLRRALEAVIERHVAALPQDAGQAQTPRLALEVAQELQLELNLWRVQNLFWQYLIGGPTPPDLPTILNLGTHLGFNRAVVRKLLHMYPS